MPFTLTTHGTPLGRTGAELPGLATDARGWHFIPAPAFESVRPVLLEVQQATMGLQELMPSAESLAAIREDERAAFIQHALMSDPHASRFLELMDAMEAMQLTLHDDAGTVVPTRTLGVAELELSPEAFREVLVAIDATADPALSAVPPFYLLVAGT